MNEKQKLEEQFNRIRQEAIDNNEPTAIVLAANRHRGEVMLSVESFSVREWLAEQGVEGAINLAQQEANHYGKPVWLMTLVGHPRFASEPDAFEEAWDNQEYYFKSRAEAV